MKGKRGREMNRVEEEKKEYSGNNHLHEGE